MKLTTASQKQGTFLPDFTEQSTFTRGSLEGGEEVKQDVGDLQEDAHDAEIEFESEAQLQGVITEQVRSTCSQRCKCVMRLFVSCD